MSLDLAFRLTGRILGGLSRNSVMPDTELGALINGPFKKIWRPKKLNSALAGGDTVRRKKRSLLNGELEENKKQSASTSKSRGQESEETGRRRRRGTLSMILGLGAGASSTNDEQQQRHSPRLIRTWVAWDDQMGPVVEATGTDWTRRLD